MMPYFTLVPYLIFGRSRFAGYVNARRFNDDRLREIRHGMTPEDRQARSACVVHAPEPACMRALPRLTGMPCLANNDVRLLVNGTATFDAIFEAIAAATQVVIVQFFIVHDDVLGRRLQALLCERAQAGIKVYFLYDSIGCHALPRGYVKTLLAAASRRVHSRRTAASSIDSSSISATIASSSSSTARTPRGRAQRRGRVSWRATAAGAVARYAYQPARQRRAGPADAFAEDWYWAAREVPYLLMPPPDACGSMICQVVPTGPADAQETCSLFFVEAIQSARHRIWITSPYFVPDEAVFAVLRLAVLRGVDVRILIPARPDHLVVFAASSLYAHQAVTAGIKLYRYQPGFLHQKVLLIDDDAAAVGTANLDNRSFRLNFELMVMTADRKFAGQVAEMLESDFAQARRIGVDEFLRAPAPLRVAMHVAKLFAPIL